MALLLQPLPLLYKCRVLLLMASFLGIGTAQFQTCYDNTAANCGGNVVTGVSTVQDCCLGNGFWFRDPNLGGCVQCIVHGFERSMVSVDEGGTSETLVIRLDIKGNTLDEPAPFQVTRINFTVVCQDVTTESDDYSSATCDSVSVTRLNLNDPGPMNSEVYITLQADNRALEGTEELQLGFQLTTSTQIAVTISGNIFFQNTSIQIRDTTALRPTFSLVVYEGNEGPDRGSSLDPAPCHVIVRLEGTIIEEDLTIRLIPRTFSENVAVNGPPPSAEHLGFNASRMDFNDTQPFEVTIPAGTTAISGNIPIVDDEINEGTEEFVVVLEVASVTTNPVDFTGQTQTQTTVCRIPANDPIEIGFRQPMVQHNEEERLFTVVLEKDRPSELDYVVDIVIRTPNTGDGQAATFDVDFLIGFNIPFGTIPVRMTPACDRTVFSYQIRQDYIPEDKELIQLSSRSNELPFFFCDDDPMFRFNGRDCFRDLQIQILDDDVVVVGFVKPLVKVDERDGRATLSISISSPPPGPLFQFEIMFTLLANTVDGSAGSRPTFAFRRDPRPGIEDYQQIANTVLNFNDAQRSQTFDVTIFEDEVPEDVEELNITLILDPATVGIARQRVTVDPAVATVRIRDSD